MLSDLVIAGLLLVDLWLLLSVDGFCLLIVAFGFRLAACFCCAACGLISANDGC